MKTIYQFSIAAWLMLLCVIACKKDEQRVIYQGGTAPVLSVATGAQVKYADTNQTAVTLAWTNPNYQFNTGVSSLNVSYNLQIDTVADFSSANKKVITVSQDLTYSILVQDLNDIMLNQLLLDTNVTYTLYMRVVSNLTNNSAKLVSNTVQLVTAPYAIPPKVAPPSSGTLFIVGSATPGGWANPLSVDPKTQQFTQITPTDYQIIIQLTGSGEYKFIAVNGSWNDQWSIAKADDPAEVNGGDFVYNAANIKAPPISGKYKIDVNFQTGKFSVVAQ